MLARSTLVKMSAPRYVSMSVIMKRSICENPRRLFQLRENPSQLLRSRTPDPINASSSDSFHSVDSHLATLSSLGAASASRLLAIRSPPHSPAKERVAVKIG